MAFEVLPLYGTESSNGQNQNSYEKIHRAKRNRPKSDSESESEKLWRFERKKKFFGRKTTRKITILIGRHINSKVFFPLFFLVSFRPRVEIGTLIYYWPVLFLFTWRILSLSKIAKRQSCAKYTNRQQHKSILCRKLNHSQITFEWFLPQIEPHSNSNKIYHLTRPSDAHCTAVLFTILQPNLQRKFDERFEHGDTKLAL